MTMVNGNDKVRKSTSETLGKDPVQMGELEFNTTNLAIFKQHLGQEAFFSKNVRELGSQVPDFLHVWTEPSSRPIELLSNQNKYQW